MSLHLILLFSVTVFVASIIPGPSMLLALTHGMHHGARRTTASAMGNVTVTLIQAAISMAGLGTVLMASEAVFQCIKWAGAGYLIYTGICLLSSNLAVVSEKNQDREEPATFHKLFTQGALVTAGNPKAILFFTAVFPQFIAPDASYVSQACIMMGICGSIGFTCYMIYAMGGQKVVGLFSRGIVGKYANKAIGGTFIGAGIGLAASNR